MHEQNIKVFVCLSQIYPHVVTNSSWTRVSSALWLIAELTQSEKALKILHEHKDMNIIHWCINPCPNQDYATFESEADDTFDQTTPTPSPRVLNSTSRCFLSTCCCVFSHSVAFFRFFHTLFYIIHLHATYNSRKMATVLRCSPLLLHWSICRLSDLLKGTERNSC